MVFRDHLSTVLTQTFLEIWSTIQFVAQVLSFDEANDIDINPNVLMTASMLTQTSSEDWANDNDINPKLSRSGQHYPCWSNLCPAVSLTLLIQPRSRDWTSDYDDVDQTSSINVDPNIVQRSNQQCQSWPKHRQRSGQQCWPQWKSGQKTDSKDFQRSGKQCWC